VPLPTPPETAPAVAGPWPLKLTDSASPVLPATLALGRPVAGIAVADASPPKDTAIAAEQSQPSEFQPNEKSTKAETASRMAASELTVALSEGADGLSGAPPLATPEPAVAEVLTDSDGALLAEEEAGTEADVATELTGIDEEAGTGVLCTGLAPLATELVAVIGDSGTEADAEALGETEPETFAPEDASRPAVPEVPVAPAKKSLAPAELVSTALVTTSSTAEPATATTRQPSVSRTVGLFILAPDTAWPGYR
jgi:hypothetical protein